MCDILAERIRIIQILRATLNNFPRVNSATLEELSELGLNALRNNYQGTCPDECLRDKARSYALMAVWRRERERTAFTRIAA